MPQPYTKLQRVLIMASLVIAGEALFGLPFHVARFFRPTLLAVFGLTNLELGAVMSVYGVVAMIAYVPGGPLADRFAARDLMAGSLFMTAVGGVYYAQIPDFQGLQWLFGFWGVTTILLFWAALIRATREWGSAESQGRAYGLLDSGRGLLAAVIASAGVAVLHGFLPADPTTATPEERAAVLRMVIYVYVGVTILAGVLVLLFVPRTRPQLYKAVDPDASAADVRARKPSWSNVALLLRHPTLWLQATIVVCAYVAFKGVDYYGLFAIEWGMDQVDSAKLATVSAWVRPVAALTVGILYDRLSSSRVVYTCFVVLIVSYALFATVPADSALVVVLYANVAVGCLAIYGMRAVYFALLEAGNIPAALTGTAVGMVSFVGYTPDVFVAPLAGWLLDTSPGMAGYQHLFWLLTAFSAVGLLASVVFFRLAGRGETRTSESVAAT